MKGKKIVLGITGSIAAYKAAILIRGLIKKGAEVQVVITPAGKEFITPITLSALTSKPVVSEFFAQRDGTWNSHVDLGLWADAMVIAPATASTIGIAEKAKNQEAAEAFVRFLYTDDMSKAFAEKCAVPAATKTDMSAANLTETAKQVYAMINSEDVTMVAKAGTSWGSVDGTINDCINKLVSGDYTVDEAVEALEKATNKKNG